MELQILPTLTKKARAYFIFSQHVIISHDGAALHSMIRGEYNSLRIAICTWWGHAVPYLCSPLRSHPSLTMSDIEEIINELYVVILSIGCTRETHLRVKGSGTDNELHVCSSPRLVRKNTFYLTCDVWCSYPTVLVVYDALLSLSSEVTSIWNRRFGTVTVLYLIIRYMTITVSVFRIS